MDEELLIRHSRSIKRVLDEISKVVIGKEGQLKLILSALVAGGHVLIEGFPGTAKTLTAKAFAKAIGGIFKRIQFTSDTLPSDVTGFYLYTPAGKSNLIRGPVFSNILLADELNRAPPRTQAALLEAMQEGQVTIEGETYSLPEPFMVIATQLPYGFTGTYPLPEVQIDRFMFRIWSGYSTPEEEAKVIEKIDYIDRLPVEQVVTLEEIIKVREMVREIYVSKDIVNYIEEILGRIRENPEVLVGPSTRGAIALYKGARAVALLEERSFVIPDDIKFLLHPSLDHRIKVRGEAEVEGVKPEDILDSIISEVPVPK